MLGSIKSHNTFKSSCRSTQCLQSSKHETNIVEILNQRSKHIFRMRLVRIFEEEIVVLVIEATFGLGVVDSGLENEAALLPSLLRGKDPNSFRPAGIVRLEVSEVRLSAAVGHDPDLEVFGVEHLL